MQTSGQAECGRPQNPTQSVSLGSPLPTRLKQFLLTSFLVLSLKLTSFLLHPEAEWDADPSPRSGADWPCSQGMPTHPPLKPHPPTQALGFPIH